MKIDKEFLWELLKGFYGVFEIVSINFFRVCLVIFSLASITYVLSQNDFNFNSNSAIFQFNLYMIGGLLWSLTPLFRRYKYTLRELKRSKEK